MAEDVSNKTLVALLVVAIFVSLGGTLLSLNKLGSVRYITGLATSTDFGSAYLDVNETVSIAVSDSINVTDIELTQTDAATEGHVNTLDGDSAGMDGFTIQSAHLNVTNDGSGIKVNVTINQSKTDAGFIDGSLGTAKADWISTDYAGDTGGDCDDITTSLVVDGDPAGVLAVDTVCSMLEPGGIFFVYGNFTLPDDTTGTSSGSTPAKDMTLTFVGTGTA